MFYGALSVFKYLNNSVNFVVKVNVLSKVIYTEYSKHHPYTVAHTTENVKSWFKSWFFPFTFLAYILPHTLNCMCVLYSNFKFEF